MAIRISPKYGSKVPEPDPNQPRISIVDRLKYERENIKPFLGDNLFPYYRNFCILYISGRYVGQGYGSYTNQTELYDQIGHILTTI